MKCHRLCRGNGLATWSTHPTTAGLASAAMDQQIEMNIPPEAATGVFADFVGVWHTKSVFVLDFSAFIQPPELRDHPDKDEKVIVAKAQVVARVRIPPEQVFEIMKALEQHLSAWEREMGKPPPTEGPLPQ